jgi:formylmethanofuran dehydrogenase subunit D
MTSGSNKTYTANVVEILENGDAILELPQEMMDELGWKEGDTLNIKDSDGAIILSKVTDGK